MRCVKAVEGASYCPVGALEHLVKGALSLGMVLDGGYIFRSTTSDGQVLPQRVSQQAMNKRLCLYLSQIGLFLGETTHSLRGGCAIVFKLCH